MDVNEEALVGDLLEADPEASGMFDVYRLADRVDGHAAGLNQHSRLTTSECWLRLSPRLPAPERGPVGR